MPRQICILQDLLQHAERHNPETLHILQEMFHICVASRIQPTLYLEKDMTQIQLRIPELRRVSNLCFVVNHLVTPSPSFSTFDSLYTCNDQENKENDLQ